MVIKYDLVQNVLARALLYSKVLGVVVYNTQLTPTTSTTS